MALHSSVKRFMLLIEKTQNGYPAMKELVSYFEEYEIPASARTLQRDFKRLRDDYQIDIAYYKSKNGYRVDSETSTNAGQFLQFLDVLHTADLLHESLEKSKETLRYIDFDTDIKQSGSHRLKDLLTALRENRELKFTHESFFREKPKTYEVQPYLLKEYLNRRYLVGKVKGLQEQAPRDAFRTFGIDRITDLTVLPGSFTPDPKIEPKAFFDHVIGLTYSTSTLQNVVLSFNAEQGKYVKTLPWHKSQKILEDTDDELRIQIVVKPNFELTQKILMQGDNVEVIKPESLKNEVKNHLKKALKKYEC